MSDSRKGPLHAESVKMEMKKMVFIIIFMFDAKFILDLIRTGKNSIFGCPGRNSRNNLKFYPLNHLIILSDNRGKKMENLKKMLSELPPAFGRQAIEQLLPRVISSKTLANLHSLGLGPECYKLGRNVFYDREIFISWLLEQLKK